jgi:hypothetical protein
VKQKGPVGHLSQRSKQRLVTGQVVGHIVGWAGVSASIKSNRPYNPRRQAPEDDDAKRDAAASSSNYFDISCMNLLSLKRKGGMHRWR